MSPTPHGRVIGVGVDAVDIERFRVSLARTPSMRTRLFTAEELAYVAPKSDPVPSLAARFAAREAVMKAMGLGLGAFGFHEAWVDAGAERRAVAGDHRSGGRAGRRAGDHRSGCCRSPTPTWSPSPTSSLSSGHRRDGQTERVLPIVTPEEMQVIDAWAPEPEEVLIERAGSAVARVARRMLGGTYGRTVVVIAGKGNNGADGRVAARVLAARRCSGRACSTRPRPVCTSATPTW